MRLPLHLRADDSGAAAVEMAFVLPIFIVMIWAFVQLADVYRAVAGMQQALGEGARFATLCYSQSSSGCAAPAAGSGRRRPPVRSRRRSSAAYTASVRGLSRLRILSAAVRAPPIITI
jgi:Flp pilus assembly protein TadG